MGWDDVSEEVRALAEGCRSDYADTVLEGPQEAGSSILGVSVSFLVITASISEGLDMAVEKMGGCPAFLSEPIARALDGVAYATAKLQDLSKVLIESGYDSWEECAQYEKAVADRVKASGMHPGEVTGMRDEKGISEDLARIARDGAPHVLDRYVFLQHIEQLLEEIGDDRALTPQQSALIHRALRDVQTVREQHARGV